MIYLLSLLLHLPAPAVADSGGCRVVQDPGKFKSIELKLNLDGNSKPDVVAIYDVGETAMKDSCERRALLFDAPEKPGPPKPSEWLGNADYVDAELRIDHRDFESLSVGSIDLLRVTDSAGSFLSQTYFSGEGGKLKKMLSFGNAQWDGQLTETYDKKMKKLGIRIFDSGTLEVAGTEVDLDQKAIKSRCRVRGLHIQLKYDWDPKDKQFRLSDEGCVMGPAID